MMDDNDVERELLREALTALEPFGKEAALWHEMWADDFHPIQDTSVSCSQCGESMEKPERARFAVGDLRRARAAADKIRAALGGEKP